MELLRSRTGLSIREVASRIGKNFAYMARLHNGDREEPSLELCEDVATVYRTTAAYIRTGDVAVDVWGDMVREDDQFRVVGTGLPVHRVHSVVYYCAFRYPGHMRIEDWAKYLDMPSHDLAAVLSGRHPLTDKLLVNVGALTGVPVNWLRIGHLAFFPQDALSDWSDLQAILHSMAAAVPA